MFLQKGPSFHTPPPPHLHFLRLKFVVLLLWWRFFKECPHPDENQRRQLSRELGLEAKQIKFWFQNKRTQKKVLVISWSKTLCSNTLYPLIMYWCFCTFWSISQAQSERADNSVLRLENERIQCENLAIIEALKNVICPACGGPPFGEEERQRSLQKLKQENARLKEEASLDYFNEVPFLNISSFSIRPFLFNDP